MASSALADSTTTVSTTGGVCATSPHACKGLARQKLHAIDARTCIKGRFSACCMLIETREQLHCFDCRKSWPNDATSDTSATTTISKSNRNIAAPSSGEVRYIIGDIVLQRGGVRQRGGAETVKIQIGAGNSGGAPFSEALLARFENRIFSL